MDRYQLFFFVKPDEAVFIHDPTDHAFEICLTAHSWIENVLLADRRSHAGASTFTDEYYDRFYAQAGAVLVRQLSESSMDVGSYWMTAWINAGRPYFPPPMNPDTVTQTSRLPTPIDGLPKAELHLHSEGSIRPATAIELAARHGVTLTPEDVETRYRYSDFRGFLEAFKWVYSFLPAHPGRLRT